MSYDDDDDTRTVKSLLQQNNNNRPNNQMIIIIIIIIVATNTVHITHDVTATVGKTPPYRAVPLCKIRKSAGAKRYSTYTLTMCY